MKKTLWLSLALAGLLGVATLSTTLVGCSDGGNNGTPDGGTADLLPTPDMAEPTCYTNPTTHNELINSCPPSGVEQLTKNPTLPLLRSDGSLPPLP